MIANGTGSINAYALRDLQDRGTLFVAPGDPCYEGLIVGEHCRDNDIVVNPTRAKRLTNMRNSGGEENIMLKPPRQMTLEQALEYIEEDELVEVTPGAIRLRKDVLSEIARKRAGRKQAETVEA